MTSQNKSDQTRWVAWPAGDEQCAVFFTNPEALLDYLTENSHHNKQDILNRIAHGSVSLDRNNHGMFVDNDIDGICFCKATIWLADMAAMNRENPGIWQRDWIDNPTHNQWVEILESLKTEQNAPEILIAKAINMIHNSDRNAERKAA